MSSILHALRKLPPVSEGGRLFLETNDSGSAERHGLLAALATVAVMGWLLGTSAGLVVRRVWAPSWEPTTVARLAPANEAARPPVVAVPPKAIEGPDGHLRDPHRRSARNAKRTGPPALSTRSPFPRASREIRKSSPAVSPLLTEQRGNDIDQPAAASVDAKPLIPSASSVEPAATLPQPEVPAASAPLFQEPVAVAGGASVEVFGNQRATVAGQATSLRSLVEEICRQAGVELRTYTAADRGYAGHLQNLPLQDVFRSVFRSESYLVGLSLDPSSREKRITWLQVLGTGTSTADAQPPAAPSNAVPGPTLVRPPAPFPAQKFVLSPTLLYEAFGTMDPARREQAQREALSRLADPARRALFLNTDPAEIANVVANYEHSAEGVRRMKSMTDLPDVQAKLDAVLNALGEPTAGNKGEETN